jgi:hypothetical protein
MIGFYNMAKRILLNRKNNIKKILYIILGFVLIIHSCTTENKKTIDNGSRFVISTPENEGFDKQLFNEILSKIEKNNYGALT